jgi:hypothetical protein
VEHSGREACAALDAVSPRGGAKSRSVRNGFFVVQILLFSASTSALDLNFTPIPYSYRIPIFTSSAKTFNPSFN